MNKPLLKYWAFLVCAYLSIQTAQAGDIVIIMGARTASPPSKEQIANVYLGRSFALKPTDAPEGSAMRDQFYKKLVDREPSQIKAVWARIVFTGKGQPPLMLPSAGEVKKAVATDPTAIGYIDKSDVDSTVKVILALD